MCPSLAGGLRRIPNSTFGPNCQISFLESYLISPNILVRPLNLTEPEKQVFKFFSKASKNKASADVTQGITVLLVDILLFCEHFLVEIFRIDFFSQNCFCRIFFCRNYSVEICSSIVDGIALFAAVLLRRFFANDEFEFPGFLTVKF